MGIKKLNLEAYFIDLKVIFSFLSYTKILNLVVFRFFLLEYFVSVIFQLILLLPLIPLINSLLLVNIRSLAKYLLEELIIEGSNVAIWLKLWINH